MNELLAQAAEEEAKGGDFSNVCTLLAFYLIFNGAYFKILVNMREYCLQSELAFTDSQMHKGIEF